MRTWASLQRRPREMLLQWAEAHNTGFYFDIVSESHRIVGVAQAAVDTSEKKEVTAAEASRAILLGEDDSLPLLLARAAATPEAAAADKKCYLD
jgi:hypothetical protein